jgi:hypothetical protein
MTAPPPLEGAALYVAAAYLVGRDLCFMSIVFYRFLPIYIIGIALVLYCLFRAIWCVREQVVG